MLFVPASMALMGDANWWLPHWLDRRLPRVDVEGSALVDEELALLISTAPAAGAPRNGEKELVNS